MLTIDDVEIIKSGNYERVIKVLQALYNGIDVKLNGAKINLVENIMDGETPVIIYENGIIQGLDDYSLTSFLRDVKLMSDEDFDNVLFRLATTKAIKQTYKKDR